jgi:hypothetical protein
VAVDEERHAASVLEIAPFGVERWIGLTRTFEHVLADQAAGEQRADDLGCAANNRFVAPVAGTYLFGASLLYNVNASTTARMNGRLVLNGTTEIKGGKGENSATHVSLATTLMLQTLVPLAPGDTVELRGYFRAADRYFAAVRPHRPGSALRAAPGRSPSDGCRRLDRPRVWPAGAGCNPPSA